MYRYDLDLPPIHWYSNFKNFEYEDATLGNKNKAGLFFFTDSLAIANDLGKSAASNKSRTEYYLTTVKIESTLNLLDFSSSINLFQMLCVLDDLKIRNLMNGFEKFENEITLNQMNQLF